MSPERFAQAREQRGEAQRRVRVEDIQVSGQAYLWAIDGRGVVGDARESELQAAWRLGMERNASHVCVDATGLSGGTGASEAFGSRIRGDQLGSRSAGRVGRVTQPADLLHAKDVRFCAADGRAEGMLVSAPAEGGGALVYKRGEGASGGPQGSAAACELAAGCQMYIQGAVQLKGAARSETFVADLDEQRMRTLVLMAVLVDAGGLARFGGEEGDAHAHSVDWLLSAPEDRQHCTRASLACTHDAHLCHLACLPTDMALRDVLQSFALPDALAWMEASHVHEDADELGEIITTHWLPHMLAAPPAAREQELARLDHCVNVLELGVRLRTDPGERLHAGALQQLLHGGTGPPLVSCMHSHTGPPLARIGDGGAGGGTWKEVRSTGGLCCHRHPADQPALQPRQLITPGHLAAFSHTVGRQQPGQGASTGSSSAGAASSSSRRASASSSSGRAYGATWTEVTNGRQYQYEQRADGSRRIATRDMPTASAGVYIRISQGGNSRGR